MRYMICGLKSKIVFRLSNFLNPFIGLFKMKRFSHILFLLVFLIKTIAAQDGNILLQQAADAYTNGDYPAAIQQYEQILANGEHAFEVYYNLANAYFKDNQIAPAILNYERANRLDPADADLQHNLRMAQSRTVDNINMIPVPELVTGYKSFVNSTPADRWGAFSLVAFVLALIGIAAFLYLGQRWMKQMAVGSGVVLLLLSLFFFFLGWQQSNWLNSQKEAVIFQSSITVSSTPNDSGEELFVLHEGTKVRIVERFREWVRVRIGDGNMGWMPGKAVREI